MPRFAASSVRALAALALAALAATAAPAVRAQPAAPPPSAVVTLGRSTVTGFAPGGGEVSVEVATGGGVVKGSATGRPLPLIGYFSLDALDVDGQPAGVAAGDRVTVRAGAAQIADIAPALTVSGDADRDTVRGTAPAGAPVTVTVQSGLGLDAVARGAVADGGGRFSVDFSGAYDLQAGTTLRVDRVQGPFTFRAERPLAEQLAIRLYDATVGGVAPVGAPVVVELARRSDQAAGRGAATAGFLGLWSAPLVNAAGEAVDVRPGDRLRLLEGGSMVLEYTVPELPVTADAAADTVRGVAPAGGAVSVSVGGGANPPTVAVAAAADGAWTASFAGKADIAPGSVGQLAVGERKGDVQVTVTRAWAVVRLAVRIGEPVVNGVATPGDGVRLNLKDARGSFKGNTALEVNAGGFFGGGATFAATLADLKGETVDVRPTDLLEFRQGATRIDLPIPTLTADVDTTADTVSGTAPAGAALRVTASILFFNASRDVVADASGRYTADFKGAFDLVGGVGVEVVYTVPEGHTITYGTAASAVRVWPEAGHVDGSVAGGAVVTVSALSASGQVKGRGTATANFLGQFDAPLYAAPSFDPAGPRYFPAPGDRIRLAFDNATKEMTVPALSIEWDTVRERIFGEATSGGMVSVRARPPAGQSNAAVTRDLPIDAVGAYDAVFAPDQDLRAASRVEITYTYPNGDRSRIDRVLPYLNVQVGGNAVSGYALPRVPVIGRLKDGTAIAGAGNATADDAQAFDLRVISAAKPVAITPGRAVDVEFEARRIGLTVDNLSARFLREAGQTTLVGTAPVSTALSVRFVGANGQPRNANVTADGSGAWRLALPGGVDGLGGTSATVAFLNAEGHRQWSLARIARLVAHIGTPRVDVQAMPLARASLVLATTTGGPALRTVDVDTDTAGDATAALAASGSGLAAGQSIAATIAPSGASGPAAESETASMTVADVRLALDVLHDTVTGRVPVGTGALARFAQVRLWPRGGGAVRNLAVPTDADGAFTLDTSNPPGFGARGAALASFERVEVVHTNAEGHQTVAEAAVRIAIFAPFVGKYARR